MKVQKALCHCGNIPLGKPRRSCRRAVTVNLSTGTIAVTDCTTSHETKDSLGFQN